MRPVVTAAEMRAIEREAGARGTPVALLMERAGHAVARAAVELAGGAYGRRAVVVCGKGNNGGDGMVAARYLASWGMAPAVTLLGEPGELAEPARSNHALLERAGVPIHPFEPTRLDRELARADVAIDAIFGIGFRGAPREPATAAIDAFGDHDVPVVSADIASGVESDTAAIHGSSVNASVTVTFGAPKIGNVVSPGAWRAGRVEVADIGFPDDALRSDVALVDAEDVRALLPRRPAETHKRRSGVVLVVAGSRRMTGAARLLASGALAAGAGLVTVAVPEGILGVVQVGVAEATFLPLPEDPDGALAIEAWDRIAGVLDGVDAVAVGPGLSTNGAAPDVVRRLVRGSPRPVVADADALNAFAGSAGDLSARGADLVLTPHEGEFARLFGTAVEDLAADRLGHVRKAAAATRATVLLKGSRTLVATPEGSVRINPTGTPALATGGTGDVLTGAIAAFAARGLGVDDAAIAAAFVHGLAGRLAARGGDEGAVAGGVVAALPRAIGLVHEGRA